MNKHALHLSALISLCLFVTTTIFSQIIINEIYADVATNLIGDANGDGTRSAKEDEFIELFNLTDVPIDLSGYTVTISETVKHQFAEGAILPPKNFLVIFGAGTPRGLFGNSQIILASTGNLSLSNSGATVLLKDTNEVIVDSISYAELNIDASWVRTPEFTGNLLPHTQRPDAFGTPFSPGTLTNSFPYNNGDTTLLHFTINKGTAIERDTAIDLFLNLINPKPTPVIITIELTGGTGSPMDLAGFTNQIINFPVNSISQRKLSIPITNDDLIEGMETFIFTITSISEPNIHQISINKSFELTLFDDDTDFGLILTEFLADPPSDETGDANMDGLRSSSQDEFLEFQNITNQAIDLSGMRIFDKDALRHHIPEETIIQPTQFFVLFGGGLIGGNFGNAVIQKASTNRLGLANEGDRIIIKDSLNNIAFFHEYGKEGGNNQSIVYCPNLGDDNGPNTLHQSIDNAMVFSPGKASACNLITSTKSMKRYPIEIQVYPNPASHEFVIVLPDDLTFLHGAILDVSGRIVFTLEANDLVILPPTLRAGLYFLSIQTNEGTFVKKIVLE